VRDALRSIRRRPAASLIVVSILGSAIAAAVVLASFFAAVVSQTPPVGAPDTLVHVWRADDSRPAGHREPAAADFHAFERARTIRSVTATTQQELLVGAPEGRVVPVLRVTREYFTLAGRQPRMGRAFGDADFARNVAVIISDAIWRDRFQADPNVIGRVLHVDAAPREVVGVMPPDFWLPTPGVQAWLPYRAGKASEPVDITGRLADGTTVADAQAECDVLLRRADPITASRDTRTLIRTFGDESRVRSGPLFRALVAPAIAVLLIACANIANLLIIGMKARDREFAIRTAIGASPAALARLAIAESTVLAVAGGLAGALLSLWGVRLLQVGIAAAIPSLAGSVHMTRFVPLTATLATMMTMIATAALPARSAAKREVLPALSGAGRSAISKRFGYGAGDVLVVVQVGLAVAFVVSTAMLVRVALELGRQLRPVVHGDVYVARLVTRGEVDRQHQHTVYDGILDSVRRSGGVAHAALASEPPMPAAAPQTLVTASTAGVNDCRVGVVFVSRSYFDTIGARFERGTLPESGEAAVVNASAARKCWDAGAQEWKLRLKAEGSRTSDGASGWLPVAAVAPDLYAGPPHGHADLNVGDPAMVWIVDGSDWPAQLFLIVRPVGVISSVSIAAAVGGGSRAVAMEPLVRVEEVAAEVVRRQLSLLLGILIVVGVMALVLAFVGVYAALSQSCSLRLRELGVRLALGASAPRLVATAVSRDAPLVAAGIVVGVVGTLWVTEIVWRDLLLISAADPLLWIAVVGTLAAAALFATLGPALRAVRVDPIAVLRSE